MVSRAQVPVTVVTATGPEYAQARKALRGTDARVIRTGIALKETPEFISGIAISCGLAGGLRDDLETGTVVIPRVVRRPDGTELYCDPQLVEELEGIAQTMQLPVTTDPLLTSATLVRGKERARWAHQGYAAVDMETGLLQADRLACVRIVLDTPDHEFHEAWLSGTRAAFTPTAWLDLPFLMRNGPRLAHRAAEVIRRFLHAR